MAQDQGGIAVTSPAAAKQVHSTAAARMRLQRQRRSRNLRYVMVELREREIDALIRPAGLPPDDRADHAAIRQALYGFFDDHRAPSRLAADASFGSAEMLGWLVSAGSSRT
jgi:hypothetical protein